ncbi:MAG: hypothetical protein OXP71_03320 [Candidatus Poribacteria bacterium]|nr:hypothetical protein [Candidatus Poribacteria bacterium]
MVIKPENSWTADDRSFTVLVYNYNPCNQGIVSVLKYSEKKYSPLLWHNIRFSTPERLRSLDTSAGSELLKDKLEATSQKIIPIEKPSELHDNSANSLNADSLQIMTQLKLTFRYDAYWIYSTTSQLTSKDAISPDYDCITRIENPYKFALLIGRNIANNICSEKGFARKHLETRSHGKDFETYKRFRESHDWIGETIIVVTHGFVKYTYGEFEIDDAPPPFKKRREYSGQHEYRFTVQVLGHSLKRPYLDIESSPEMKNLMAVVDEDFYESLANEDVSPRNMIESLNVERIQHLQLQCREGHEWVKVCDYDPNTYQPVDINTSVSQKYLNLELLEIDVPTFYRTGRLSFRLKEGALKRDSVTGIFRCAIKCAGHPSRFISINLIKDLA